MTQLRPQSEHRWIASPSHRWIASSTHRQWLLNEAQRLLRFFAERSIDPSGGFYTLTVVGTPRDCSEKRLVSTARMVHCYALGVLLGFPDAVRLVHHGLEALCKLFMDRQHGGFYWSVDSDGSVIDGTKQAYGHAFALLAGSSAYYAGFADALEVLEAADEVLESRFWDDGKSWYREEFAPDWATGSEYRGGNSNMHLVEALRAAFDVTQDQRHLSRANSVASKLIDNVARHYGWRPVEHFREDGEVDEYYNRETPRHTYRPYGVVVGHECEWARLLLQLGGPRRANSWHLDAAEALFLTAMQAWDEERGGLFYTTDLNGNVLDRDHYQWPIAEGIGAAAALLLTTGRAVYEKWYRNLWCFAADHLFDRQDGGWFNLLDEALRPLERPGVAEGKPDLYHSLQCCLVPLLDPERSVAAGVGRLCAAEV